MNMVKPRLTHDVLACGIPQHPAVKRLSLRLEAPDLLVVRAWLGEDDEGAQLEMIGEASEPWAPSVVTLGGTSAHGDLADAIERRFGVSGDDAQEVERLLRRSGIVGSIALEAGGAEELRHLEVTVRERLAAADGVSA